MAHSISKVRSNLFIIYGLAVALAVSWLFLPLPLHKPEGYNPATSVAALFDMVIAVGGAVMFLRALRDFRQELKPAYRFIAFGQLALSLATLIAPVTIFLNLWSNPIFNTLAYLGYFTASILAFFGMRRFARLMQLKTLATSAWLIFGLAIAAWVGHAFLPHASLEGLGMSESDYDIFEIIPTIPLFTYGAAVYLTLRLQHQIGFGYKKALRWLSAGLGLQFTAAVLTAIMEIVGYDNWLFNSGLYGIAIIGGDICMLTAAYQFTIIGLPNEGGWLKRLFKAPVREVSSVDIIIYAAGLVSEPAKIDPTLEELRLITSKARPGSDHTFTADEQATLRRIYLKIESYLMKEDALRYFDQDELRTNISNGFLRNKNIDHTFWPQIAA